MGNNGKNITKENVGNFVSVSILSSNQNTDFLIH